MIEPGPERDAVILAPAVRVELLRWTMGALCAFLGSLLLVAPHRFAAPIAEDLDRFRLLWGAAALAAGTGLLAVAVVRPRRLATLLWHVLAAAVLAGLAASFARAGIWVAAATHGLLAAGVLAAGLPLRGAAPGARRPDARRPDARRPDARRPDARRPDARRPDLFALLMAAVAAINGLAGLALVAWPGLARAADFDPSRHRLPALGLLLLAGGLLLGTAQLWRRAPARFVRAAHLAAAAGFLAFGAGVSLPQRAWTALAVNSAYALVLALAPWLSRRLDRRSPPSLRARLALVLAVATSLALVATAALATWQEERLALEQMRAAQEVEAQAIAANLAEFLRLTGEGRPWAVVPRIGRAGARVEVWNRDGERIGGGHADGRGLDLPPLPAGWQRAVLAGLRPEVGARLVGFARVPGRDWLVTVERSPGAELGRVRRGRDLALLLLLLVLPLAVLGGVLLARRITRPLSALSAAVSAMAAGQPAVPVAASDIGEVARLSGAFSELRARLAERTRESERLAAELRSRAEALSESDRRKDEFLAMLAHELRNPLSAIANAAHLLHELVPEEERLQKAAAIVRRQVGHLVRLVDDLLDVSRITRGKVALRREALDLRDSVRQAVDTARPLFEAKRQFLRLELPPAPLPLWADPTRLEQVIGNLLRNAAKYTDPGGHVEIAAALDGDQAVLRVRDDGQGIAPELLPQIFDLFVQGGETQERAGAGLGIGLTLVRRLVTLHGGSVEASSDGPGAGAEFVVRLPAAETAPATPAQTGAPAASGRGLP